MICKRCSKTNVIKAGFTRGEQRYKCKDCGLHFVKQYTRLNENDRLRAFRFCAYGVPMNTVAKMFCVTATTITRWVKWYEKHPNNTELASDTLDGISVKLWLCYGKSARLDWIFRFQLKRLNIVI